MDKYLFNVEFWDDHAEREDCLICIIKAAFKTAGIVDEIAQKEFISELNRRGLIIIGETDI